MDRITPPEYGSIFQCGKHWKEWDDIEKQQHVLEVQNGYHEKSKIKFGIWKEWDGGVSNGHWASNFEKPFFVFGHPEYYSYQNQIVFEIKRRNGETDIGFMNWFNPRWAFLDMHTNWQDISSVQRHSDYDIIAYRHLYHVADVIKFNKEIING